MVEANYSALRIGSINMLLFGTKSRITSYPRQELTLRMHDKLQVVVSDYQGAKKPERQLKFVGELRERTMCDLKQRRA